MEKLTWAEAIIPIVTFWGVINSLRETIKFLNDLRDTIISKSKDETKSSPEHKNMYFDWCLTYLSAVLAFILFTWLLWWMSQKILKVDQIKEACFPIAMISLYMLVTTIFLLLGGYKDNQLLRQYLFKKSSNGQ